MCIARVLKGKNVYKAAQIVNGTMLDNYTIAETKMVTSEDTTWVLGIDGSSEQGQSIFFRKLDEFFEEED